MIPYDTQKEMAEGLDKSLITIKRMCKDGRIKIINDKYVLSDIQETVKVEKIEKPKKLNKFEQLMKDKFKSAGFYTMDTFPAIIKFSSGSIQLDKALGGGYPVGKVVELFGNESSGKTTLALHAILEKQKLGERSMFVDMENALDMEYVNALGINDLTVITPTHGEQAVDLIRGAIESKEYSLIVIDSVSTMLPLAELNGETGDKHMGLHARMMSQALRMINPIAARNGVTTMFINQVRIKIGVMYGNPETTTGGKALDFYSTQRLRISRKTTDGGQVKQGKDNIGTPTYVEVIKNKVGKPFQKANIVLLYGKGIDLIGDLLESLLESEIMVMDEKECIYNEEGIGKTSVKIRGYIEENYKELLEVYNNSL